MTNRLPRAALCVALAGAALIPVSAKAWWHGGVFIGLPPIIVGPPVYAYPPPAYYYPPVAPYPPGYYAPGYPYAAPPGGAQQSAPQASSPQASGRQMSQANTPYGSICYAGVYTCAAAPQSHVGSGCACPGIGAPSYGSVQ
jgi:hypothetical protein